MQEGPQNPRVWAGEGWEVVVTDGEEDAHDEHRGVHGCRAECDLRRHGRPGVRLSDLNMSDRNICPADDGYSPSATRIFAYSASVLLVQLLKIREESDLGSCQQ
jgi:hypothetical protein